MADEVKIDDFSQLGDILYPNGGVDSGPVDAPIDPSSPTPETEAPPEKKEPQGEKPAEPDPEVDEEPGDGKPVTRISLKSLPESDRKTLLSARSLANQHGIAIEDAMLLATGKSTLAEIKGAKKPEEEQQTPTEVATLQQKLIDAKTARDAKGKEFSFADEMHEDADYQRLQQEVEDAQANLIEAKTLAKVNQNLEQTRNKEAFLAEFHQHLNDTIAEFPDAEAEGTALYETCQDMMAAFKSGDHYQQFAGKPECAAEIVKLAAKRLGIQAKSATQEAKPDAGGVKPLTKVAPVPGSNGTPAHKGTPTPQQQQQYFIDGLKDQSDANLADYLGKGLFGDNAETGSLVLG